MSKKRTVYMIANNSGQYAEFNMAGDVRWCNDPAFGFKYNSEEIARDIADRYPSGKVIPVQVPLDWWRNNPKAVEALEYLLSIGMNSDEFAMADAHESGDVE